MKNNCSIIEDRLGSENEEFDVGEGPCVSMKWSGHNPSLKYALRGTQLQTPEDILSPSHLVKGVWSWLTDLFLNRHFSVKPKLKIKYRLGQ